MSENEFINFGDVVREKVGMQCQYASMYIDGICERENLGVGLRFRNLNHDNYHIIEIHRDDVDEFVRRLKKIKGLK